MQTAEAGSTGRARVTALEGLLSITEYVAYPKLHPYRKQVEQSTLRMLDDRKRAVRYLAGTLRNKWMLLMK